MSVFHKIRNAFYAAFHAEQLMDAASKSKALIDIQRQELTEIRAAYNTVLQEKQYWQAQCKKATAEDLTIARPPEMATGIPVGRIDYLDAKGRCADSVEYPDAEQFVRQVKADNFNGIPMSVTVYSDPHSGAHIDTTWRKDLDPPPQGFSVEPFPGEESTEPSADASVAMTGPEVEYAD